jgi:hypothetical protein
MILSVGLKAFPFFSSLKVAVKIFPENYRSFVKLVLLLVQLIRIVYKKHIGHGNKILRTGCKK